MNENSVFHHKLNVPSQFSRMKYRFLLLIFQLSILGSYGQSIQIRIDSLLRSYYRKDQPGAVIAITQNQHTIFKKGYGLADLNTKKSITPNENFNIGSLTKQFTAFGVMALSYYYKEFSLSDPIGKYLQLPACLASIRISQLLGHSSGIPDHYGFTDTGRVKHATDYDVLEALQKADSLYFPSGTRFRYSNTAYCLLGMLIEKVTGLTYGEFLQQEIFSPLNMKNTTVFNIHKSIKYRVTGYELLTNGNFKKSDSEESIFYSTEADGGIYLSMNNYMKWCAALEKWNFPNIPVPFNLWQGQTLVDTLRGLRYGNGWFILEPGTGPKIVYHTGFNGGFRTVVLMIPSINYYISIFSNRSDIDLEDLVSRINQILQIPDNSFIKSGPFESFNHSWPKFAPCKETSSFSTLSIRNLNAKDMVLN